MTTWTKIAPYVILSLILAGILFMIVRTIWKEMKEATTKDAKENTTTHTKNKLKEYGIILAVGIVAFVAVSFLKAGPMKGLSETIWGKPQPTIESPFFGDK